MASKVGLLAPPPETTNSRKRPATRQHEAAYGIGDRTRRQSCGGGDHIRLAGSSTTFDETLGELASEFFAAGGFGWLAAEKWQAQEIGNDRFENCTRRGDAAIAIVGLAEESVGHCVDHHVAGAGVESCHLLRRCSGRDCRQVRDAADVLHDAADLLIAIQQVIEEGNQRRAFASGGHVGGAEIGDDRNADTSGEHRALSGLPCDGQLAAKKFRRLALMIESLAVAADQFCFQVETALGGEEGFGVEFGEQKIQAGQIGYAGCFRVHGFAGRLGGLFFGYGYSAWARNLKDRFVEPKHAGGGARATRA